MTQQSLLDGFGSAASGGSSEALFPVVGIGASAGGLEAVRALLGAIPANPGVAFVLIQHLDPHHVSALAEILSKTTSLVVEDAVDQLPVERDHVYVITPATEMVIEGGRLRTMPRPATRRPPMAIDTFLISLALERGSRAIGVILSGTGSDGTKGLQAIKSEGGITFAQDATAAYDPMPRSAIAAGCVDFVLSPEKIAAELLRSCARMWSIPIVLEGTHVTEPVQVAVPESPTEDQDFLKILKRVSQASGVDFTNYKYPTLRRRIERRMVLCRKESLSAYLELVQDDAAELEALRHEILIQVTSFFRDPEMFDELKASVLPQLVNDRPVNSPLRIWIPGCSSGEEVYSLVICILEFLEASGLSIDIKAFATDISERAVDKARVGIYPASISVDVAPERLARFFRPSDGGYQINKVVRDACVFARQDVTRDPPFSQLDLISCRNVLIYLGSALQARVFPVFHYALKPEGFLILGNSESVGPFTDLFLPFDKRRHFFRRSSVATRLTSSFATGSYVDPRGVPFDGTSDVVARMYDVQHEADRLVLARYAPCGVVINDALEVIQFRGHTGRFLEPAPGIPTNDFLQMVRDGLLPGLRLAIDAAKSSGLPSRQENIRFTTPGGESLIHAQVIPFAIPTVDRKYFVILFEEVGPATEPTARVATVSPVDESEHEQEMTRLLQELGATKAYLQSVIEAKNFANEELKAANEEIVSSNEELQSTNEELETAKEELQATNEELGTVNSELLSRIQTSTQLNDDLTNLIDSINIPIVIVGLDQRVRRFAPHVANVFNLIPGDIGRLITDLTLRINVPELKSLIEGVIKTLAVQEMEVTDQDGHWYQLSIRPYRTIDNRIDGAVIALFDVNAIKLRENLIIAARDFSRKIIDTLHESLLLLDERLRVVKANPAFYETFRTSPSETEGQLIYSLGNSQWNIPELRGLLENLLATNVEIHDFRLEQVFPVIGQRTMLLNARPLLDHIESQPVKILLAIQDITAIEGAVQSLRNAETQIQTILNTAATAIITMDERGIVRSFNRTAETMFGYAANEAIGQNVKMLMPEPYRSAHDSYLSRYLQTGVASVIGIGRMVLGRHRNGKAFPADLAVSETVGPEGRLFTGCLLDISERRELEREVLEVAGHERQMIGQELHDITGQELVGLSFLAQSVVTTLQARSRPEAAAMVRIAEGLERALAQVRSIAKGLIPVDVTAEGLRTALQDHIEKTTELTGIACVFRCKPTVLVDNNQVATQLFFIAREAIANAVKHAHATKIELSLEMNEQELLLLIRDDGIGIERSRNANGVGLRIMAYRVGLLNGLLSIGTDTTGTGVVVTCRIPLLTWSPTAKGG